MDSFDDRKEKARVLIQNTLDALHKEAEANRITYQVGKSGGLGGAVLGGVACIAMPQVGIPVLGAATVTYVLSLFSESSTTGKTHPIPFVQTCIHAIAAGFTQQRSNVPQEDLELSDYLPKRDQVLYLLSYAAGDRLADLLAHLDENLWLPTIEGIITKTVKIRASFGQNKFGFLDAISQADSIMNVAEQDLKLSPVPRSALPVGSNTRLNAVEVKSEPLSLGSSLLKKASRPTPVMPTPTAIPEMDLTVREYVDSTPPDREIPTETNILSLPLDKRSIVVVNRMKSNGFQVDQILSKSVVAIAGEQRGGKGTLLAMLAILMKASNPNMQIHYYTAGSDLYPVGFDRVICAKSFPDSANPDTHVFEALHEQVKGLEKFENYEAKNTFIVIDEAIALGAAANPEKNQWLAKFLLTRFSKTGARAAIVLHASNLSSWLGIGNTGGMAQTFKNGASFIGCGTQGMPDPHNPLCSIQIASGEYFLADPDNFGKSLKNGDLGRVPEWLLTTKNPHNGSPDPVRSLLQFFPELVNSNPVTIAASTHKPKDDWSNYMPDEEVHHGDVQEVNDPWFVEPQSPKIAKLIEDLQRSKDDRASSFISFLSGLQVGEEISAKGIDPQFIQIAVARKILKRNGSRLEVLA